MEAVLRIAISRRLDSFPRHVTFSSRLSHTRLEKHHLGVLFFSSQKGKKKIPLLIEVGRNLSGGLRRARGLIPPVHETNPLLPLFLPSSLPASLDMIHAETAALATIFFSLHWRLPPGSPSTLRVHSLVVETGHPRAHQREERKRSEENLLRLFFTQNNNHKKKHHPHTKFVLFQLLLLTWVTATGEGGNSTLIKLLDYSIWDGINAEKKRSGVSAS